MHIDKHLSTEKVKLMQEHVLKVLGECISSSNLLCGELTVVCNKQDVLKVLKTLRDDKKCLFKILIDITAVDYPEREERFEVVYHLLSVHLNQRIRVKINVYEDDSILSVCELFESANWYERETYDMFGIGFENHPDLRRILCDYTFDGFPLRKDFPVEGKVEVYYDEKEGRVAYKPVDLPQEYRHFDNVSQWEAMTGNVSLAEDKSTVFDSKEFEEEK